MPKTDVQPADEIGLVAVELLIEQWHGNQTDETPQLQAVACLRYIIRKSPSCASAHFLLVRLYRLIGGLDVSLLGSCSLLTGAPSLVAAPLSAIKPTEIQLDNLLHSLFERGATDALVGQTTAVFRTYADQANSMYKKSATDVSDFPLCTHMVR